MNIFFSGIGGVGLGPLAQIAKDAGYEVAGSDPVESLTTKELRASGVIVSNIQDGSFLKERHLEKNIDLLVYTSAMPIDHPELIMARSLGIRTVKRDELLAQIIKDKRLKLIAIAGTHGKTTTTGMFIWALKQLNIPVSYSIGTTINFGPSGKFDPDSSYFVYECDEFDRNFLHFYPHLALITSIDYDHPDTYPTSSEYLDAFREFAVHCEQTITWKSQNGQIFDGLANINLIDSERTNQNIRLAGLHNRRNATLVQLGLKNLGIEAETDYILSKFPGTNRRFEKLAENLYSDYAHHPVEIAATLQMARELSDHVIAVYQPHQNIRQHSIKDQYTDLFELAEEIYWLPTYLSREDPSLPILSPSDLMQNLTNKNQAHAAEFNSELWNVVEKARNNGKLVLFMGAGQIDSWLREQLKAKA